MITTIKHLANQIADALLQLSSEPVLFSILAMVSLIIQSIIIVVPYSPLLVIIGHVLGPIAGGLVSSVGLSIGGISCYGLGRTLGRRFPDFGSRDDLIDLLQRFVAEPTGFLSLLLVYLSGIFPIDAMNYGLGIVRAPIGRSIALIILGPLPKIIALTVLGDSFASRSEGELNTLAAVMIVAAMLLMTVTARGWAKRMRARSE